MPTIVVVTNAAGATSITVHSAASSSPVLETPDDSMEFRARIKDRTKTGNTWAPYTFTVNDYPDGGWRDTGYCLELLRKNGTGAEPAIFGVDCYGNLDVNQSGGSAQIRMNGSSPRIDSPTSTLIESGLYGFIFQNTNPYPAATDPVADFYTHNANVATVTVQGGFRYGVVTSSQLPACSSSTLGLSIPVSNGSADGGVALELCDGASWRKLIPEQSL